MIWCFVAFLYGPILYVLLLLLAAVIIRYPFTAEPHVLLYSSAINNVLFKAVGRQMSHIYNGIQNNVPVCITSDGIQNHVYNDIQNHV